MLHVKLVLPQPQTGRHARLDTQVRFGLVSQCAADKQEEIQVGLKNVEVLVNTVPTDPL